MRNQSIPSLVCVLCGCDNGAHCLCCPDCAKIIQKDPLIFEQYQRLLSAHQYDEQSFRKHLIKNRETLASRKAGKILHNIARRVFGIKISKEHPFRPFFVDFFLPSRKGRGIAIEIDGGVHNGREQYDLDRDKFIYLHWGVKVYRFYNEEVGTEYFRRAVWNICIDLINARMAHHGYSVLLVDPKAEQDDLS